MSAFCPSYGEARAALNAHLLAYELGDFGGNVSRWRCEGRELALRRDRDGLALDQSFGGAPDATWLSIRRPPGDEIWMRRAEAAGILAPLLPLDAAASMAATFLLNDSPRAERALGGSTGSFALIAARRAMGDAESWLTMLADKRARASIGLEGDDLAWTPIGRSVACVADWMFGDADGTHMPLFSTAKSAVEFLRGSAWAREDAILRDLLAAAVWRMDLTHEHPLRAPIHLRRVAWLLGVCEGALGAWALREHASPITPPAGRRSFGAIFGTRGSDNETTLDDDTALELLDRNRYSWAGALRAYRLEHP